MKAIKAEPTVIITGIFRKRYWLIIPGDGVFEMPSTSVKETIAGKKNG